MNKTLKKILYSISPKIGTYITYYYNFHEWLNLKNPKGINQKLQFLKLKTYYNNPTVTQCVDKYRVKQYLKDKGLDNINVKLINEGYERASDILDDWDSLPNKFVIKCNHGCGYNIIVDDKNKFNVEDIVKQLDEWMKEDFWKVYCEVQYKYVKKHIIVEEYLGDDINTYKFYCFNGQPKIMYVSANGENGEKDLYVDYYDMDFNRLDITLDVHKHKKESLAKPDNFDELVEISRQLSKDFPFVRVDLYSVDGKVYFSELTFIPTGGMMKLHPEKVIYEMGEMLDI